ncbi:hypothetical protein [Flavobacterium caeni]|nr:hypothetical protein [Flavobacterium caeni]
MKKKLEAELMSIAHRILKMKNKSDLVELQQETQRLYEKLSVLRFVEDHFAGSQPTIGQIEEQLDAQVSNDAVVEAPEVAAIVEPSVEPEKQEALGEIISGVSENASKQEVEDEPVVAVEPETTEVEPETIEEEVAPVAELESPEEQVAPVEAEATAEPAPEQAEEPAANEKAEDVFKPAFEWAFDAKNEEKEPTPVEAKITPAQISFDDLLGQDYVDPVFVKPEEVETPTQTPSEEDQRAAELAESNRRLAELRDATKDVIQPRELKPEIKPDVIPISRNFNDTANVISLNKETLNERVSKGITIGLNDRIAFMKHLFNNSSEDYNRVLSQLITIDTIDEARNFIENMVKPDYNNWDGKDEYEQRFMEIIEKKFA